MNNPEYEQHQSRDREANAPPQHEELRERDMNAPPQHEELRDRHMSAQQQQPQHDGDLWSGMGTYRERFDQLQMDFIEHPKETVSKAEQLASEAVERMVNTLHDRLNRIHAELGDGSGDTERMRVAMSEYRQFVNSLTTPRAA